MKEISSFERAEYEKMMRTLGIGQAENQNNNEIKRPDRDYLVAWNFGYVESKGRSSAETV